MAKIDNDKYYTSEEVVNRCWEILKETIDFEVKDISLNYKLKVGDLVEFRVEQKFPDIKIARNIAPFLPQD